MKPPARRPDAERIADKVAQVADLGRILVLGAESAPLVSALLRRGPDARGFEGALTALPFGDGAFDTVVFDGALESRLGEDLPRALREIRRVTSRTLFLWLAQPDASGGSDSEERGRWESLCFIEGFRKHPAYYLVNEYESLNHGGPVAYMPLEKMPADALDAYPVEALAAERGLHMDMLRDSGERSDAHVARYDWACGFIRPGDRVLDAACGLGYGGHVIAHLTDASSILGIDGSEYAIDYARRSFAAGARVRYEAGFLPQALAGFDDGSFEAIVSFETLEHVEDPGAVLDEFRRLLSPGGRVIVSVPNDWSDESGKDPNPFHLHVYDWARLGGELAQRFVVEEAAAQTASQCKLRERPHVWERRARSLRRVPPDGGSQAECEWWLMVAMKSPLGAEGPYRERVFHNIAATRHPSIDYAGSYRNPWLMHSMVNVTYRLRDGAALEAVAAGVMGSMPADSNDFAAALCVQAYRVLQAGPPAAAEAAELLARIDGVLGRPPAGPMGLRWKVSLLFVKARLLQAVGRLPEAQAAFEACGREDVRPFGIHLSTKVTEAWFLAGKIAHALGDASAARRCWEQGVEYGEVLLSASLDDILINRSYPNRFNHGDGVREFTVAWDNIARCANGLHLLGRGGRMDDAALENCFQTEYAAVVPALVETRSDLVERTGELVATRQALRERTDELVSTRRALQERTQELVEVRATLVERSRMLEGAVADLQSRTHDLVETRATLLERTALLEGAIGQLPESRRELLELRLVIAERDRELESRRTALLERTGQFQAANQDLLQRTRELEETRETLAERTGQLEALGRDLRDRTAELVEVRGTLVERTERLERAERLLAETTSTLQGLADTLRTIRSAPFSHAVRETIRRLLRSEG